MAERGTHRVAGLVTAALILFADQLTKWYVIGPLALEARGKIVITAFFDLTWVENYGVSMGFLTAESPVGRWMLVALTAAITTGVAAWMWRERSRIDTMALGLVLGGAIGNIIDRTRFGHVVDFLDLHIGDWHPFLVFNVADAAITIGVVLLVLRAFLTREKKDPAENANA